MRDQAVEPERERRLYFWLLAAVTLLGLVLRLVSIGSDLWLDELAPVVNSRNTSVLRAFADQFGFNNHLLNTLLVTASLRVFGEHEWVVRLPTVLWGTATVPALYWVARQMMSRHASLCAALLLAVSYHHIFFSQDARGYTGYLWLSLVSSVLLVQGLRGDRPRVWAGFILTSVLNFAALLIGGFVLAAHMIVSGMTLFRTPAIAGGRSARVRRLCVVFALTGVFGSLVYAAVLPQMFALVRPIYANPANGFSPLSLDLLAELARGLGAGFGPGLLLGAVPFLCLAGIGYVLLVRRHWILVMALTLPCLLQAAFFLTLRLNFYPRMFILALPLAILVAVEAVTTVAASAATALKRDGPFAQGMATMVVLLLSLASMAALPPYYRTPKQPYRASLAHVEAARPTGSIVIGTQFAAGLTYYQQRARTGNGSEYFEARTLEAFDQILAAHPGRPVWVMTTFPRRLRTFAPELDGRIRKDWEIDRTFRGTIGDGDIVVWRPMRR